MEVGRSSYYEWRGRRGRYCPEEEQLKLQAKAMFEGSHGTYGSRRMASALQGQGLPVGRHKARRLMRETGLVVRRKKLFKLTTNSRHHYPVAPNLLDRQFDVAEPDRAWVADITYLWTAEGWLYLAVVLDLYSRRVVGWALKERMTAALVTEALLMALWRRKPAAGLIHHSDRGSQYACTEYQQVLKDHGAVCSMSRKGNCWDNAVMERFFGSLKRERTDLRLYATRDELKADVIDYIEMFYNSRRLHSYLGYVSPADYETAALPKEA